MLYTNSRLEDIKRTHIKNIIRESKILKDKSNKRCSSSTEQKKSTVSLRDIKRSK